MFLQFNPSWSSCQRDVSSDLCKAADEFFLDKKTSLCEETNKPSMQQQKQSCDLDTESCDFDSEPCDMDAENRIISAVSTGDREKGKK